MQRRALTIFATSDEGAIGEVNTTPLIDVMLVLLILCVISIPVMNHKVSIQLPSGPSATQPQIYRLALDAEGRLSWNGVPTSLVDLPRRLEAMEHNPNSQLEISADGAARYETFDRMLVVVKRSGVDSIAFAGHGSFASNLDR